ncbi:MAG: PBP1b-binding outer membrane lipoprotein LpoB [Parvicella sp.]|jgi:PBP1b-binding outer membrane lipoprotein LpoB
MKIVYLILIAFILVACASEEENANNAIENKAVKVDITEDIESTNKYDWQSLVLSTGYVDDIQELSEFQNSQLELIKYNFPKIESLAFSQANKIYSEYYGDSVQSDAFNVSGVHIFNDTTEIIEFYFKSTNVDRTLTPVVLFKKFKLLGTTYIN